MSFISKKFPTPGPPTGSIDAYELNDILDILDRMFPGSVRFTKTGTTFSATKADGSLVTSGQGTVASTVIQAANDYLATLVIGDAGAGEIKMARGDHTMAAALTQYVGGYSLIGDGRFATKLIGGAGQTVLTVGQRSLINANRGTYRDFTIKNGAIGILLDTGYYCVFDRVALDSQTSIGMKVNSTGTNTVSNLYLMNPLFTSSPVNLEIAESFSDTEIFGGLIGAGAKALKYTSNGNNLAVFGSALTNAQQCAEFLNPDPIKCVGFYSTIFNDIGSGLSGSDKVGIDTQGSAGIECFALINAFLRIGAGTGQKLGNMWKIQHGVILANQLYGPMEFTSPDGITSARSLLIAGNRTESGGGGSGLNGITYGNVYIQSGIIKRSLDDQVVISDHFVSYTPDTTKWLQTGTGAPTFTMQDQAGGVMRMTTSAGASDTAELTQGGRKLWDMAKLPVSIAKFKMDGTAEGYQFGFYQDATHYIKLARTTATGWQLKNKNGGSEVTAGSTTTHTDMTEWRMECNPNIIRLYKDGALVTTSTTEIPQGLFESKIFITNNDAAVHYMDLDWYEQKQIA